MNTGISLQELVAKIEDYHGKQSDMLVPSRKLEMIPVAGHPVIDVKGHAFVEPTDWAHGQISSHLGIPRAYYNRMAEDDVDLLADNVNHWLSKDEGTRLLRLQDNDLRAFLSDRYKRIDHPIVLKEALEVLSSSDVEVRSLSNQVTPNRLYLKFLFPELGGEVTPGRTIHPGVSISNSEIGGGSFQVSGFFFDDFCTNGCIFGRQDVFEGVRRRHTGARLTALEGYKVYQDDTLEAEAALLAKQSRDIVAAMSSEEQFDKMLNICRNAASTEAVDNPEKAVEVLAKEVGLSELERSKALVNLIEDKDYSKWGLASAVTKVANDTESYDRATELETMGSQILTMQLQQYHRIQVAA